MNNRLIKNNVGPGPRHLKLICLVAFLALTTRVEAQPSTLYFMRGLPQTQELNPARTEAIRTFYFGLPFLSSIDAELASNRWNYRDIVPSGYSFAPDSIRVDLNHFYNKIQKSNYLIESASLTLLDGGFRFRKNTFSLAFSERTFGQVNFDNKAIELAKSGDYLATGDTTFTGNFGFTGTHFHQIALRYSREINPDFTVGVAFKFLFGTGAMHTNNIQVTTTGMAPSDSLIVTARGTVSIATPPYAANMQTNALPVEPITSASSVVNMMLGHLHGDFVNPGYAIDLGTTYRISPKTKLSLSIVDLGMIHWTDELVQMAGQGSFIYSGTAQTLTPNYNLAVQQLQIRLSNTFKAETTARAFTTPLPAKLYLGGEYEATNVLTLSGLAQYRMINQQVKGSYTAAANLLLSSHFSMTASYSKNPFAYDNFGFGFAARMGPLQLYAASDRVLSFTDYRRASLLNLRFGANFLFGYKKVKNPACDCYIEPPKPKKTLHLRSQQ